MATPRTITPERLELAGMAADRYGQDDQRPALVLLHGLTFDRRSWRPILDELAVVDPDRRVIALDLPGHGESPSQPSHDGPVILSLIRRAIDEAGLNAPVLVGHSMSGGLATMYAATNPTRGAVNIDAVPTDLESFARGLQQLKDQIRGPGFAFVWSMLTQGFHLELLPADVREFVEANCNPQQEVAAAYWRDLLDGDPAEIPAMLTTFASGVAAARVPYLLITGAEPAPALDQLLRGMGPKASVEVWPQTGHFPHLAHPRRFAERLAETGLWTRG